jgi:hypothetical protein
MFNPELSKCLAKVINKYLSPTGYFYGCSGAHRGVRKELLPLCDIALGRISVYFSNERTWL